MNPPRLLLPSILLVLALVLLPFGRMVEIPMGVLSIVGIVVLLRGPDLRSGAPWLALGGLFFAFWLPMLFALPDAVAFEKSTINTIGALRYGFSCCALLWFYQSLGTLPTKSGQDLAAIQTRLLTVFSLCASFLLLLWCMDGLLQFFRGTNILGYGLGEGYINGVFGDDDNIKFGLTVALLLPPALVAVQRHLPTPSLWLFLFLTVSLIVLSGKRTAWVVTGVELMALALYYLLRGSLPVRRLLLFVGGFALATGLAYSGSDWVQQRSDVFAQAFEQRDYATLNRASGNRLPIWATALRMGEANPINGVGPRGFRVAYREFADTTDLWARPGNTGGSRATHAHQILLDLWAEAGVLGLLGYLVFCTLLLRLWKRASTQARHRALPYGVSLLGILFPLNSHQAWYSSSSGLILWLMLGLYLFALSEKVPVVAAKDTPA
ncbi:MAG: O-antigen ligase family protein [Congregibacter sp.]